MNGERGVSTVFVIITSRDGIHCPGVGPNHGSLVDLFLLREGIVSDRAWAATPQRRTIVDRIHCWLKQIRLKTAREEWKKAKDNFSLLSPASTFCFDYFDRSLRLAACLNE